MILRMEYQMYNCETMTIITEFHKNLESHSRNVRYQLCYKQT